MPFPLRRVLDPLVEPVSLVDMKTYLRVDIVDDDAFISSLISVARERCEDLTAACLLPQQWSFNFDHFPRFSWQGTGNNHYSGYYHGRHSMFKNEHLAIILPRGPVLSVDSITYLDMTGTLQTVSTANYKVDLISSPARILPVYNAGWPCALWEVNSVTVNFTCGFQQTAVEQVTLSATAPYTASVTRAATAVSVVSCVVTSTQASIAVSMVNGVITVPTGIANEVLTLTYTVTSIPQAFFHAIKLLVASWYDNRSEVVQGGGNFNSIPTPLSAASLLSTQELFKVGYPRG